MRAGDALWNLSCEYAKLGNQSEFSNSLRKRLLPRSRFVAFVSAMYPIVVGFNRALIRSLSKLDNVRNYSLVKGLAVQLQEEQEHNEMWRDMLTAYSVDHLALYDLIEAYFAVYSQGDLNGMTQQVVEAIQQDPNNLAPGIFPNPPFPEPVLALCHHMFIVAIDSRHCFWSHFASQSGLELMICDINTESFYPGIVGNPQVDCGEKTIAWWREHNRKTQDGARTTEEKHLEIAKYTLNRSVEASTRVSKLLAVSDVSLRLFAAAIIAHDLDKRADLPYLTAVKLAPV
jgi:hypothetical protein